MGGPGSGRQWRFDAKDTTNDYRALDVRRLHRKGLLFEGNLFVWSWRRRNEKTASICIAVNADHIVLDYRARSRGEDWQTLNYPVPLSWSACHLGGARPWFICPVRGCGRRVALLYGGKVYACRHCHGLVYESQREEPYDRLARRADRIREKLGWPQGILSGSGGPKPKGMHWATFERLVAEHDRLVDASLRGMAARLNLLGESLEDWL